MTIKVDGREVGPGSPILIVAEIGNNHDGSLGQARALVEAAARAGADAVKFQTHIAEMEMLPSTPTPPHFDEPRFEFTRRMQLSLDDHLALKSLASELGMVFFSSPFSVEAVELLEQVGVPLYKVASGEVSNPPLIETIAATEKAVLVSSGMSGIDDVEPAVRTLLDGGCEVVVLQCTSKYPCPLEDVNLRALETLRARFSCPVGLSDHTPDIYTSVAAVPLGAVVIEKHFTLSRQLYGPDHHASLEPHDLARLVSGVRQVEAALGSGEKAHNPDLDEVRASFEKSIVVATEIPEGAEIEASMLVTKRPGTGIPALRIGEIVGRRAARRLARDTLLEDRDLA